jgi:hypothetical protein
MVEINTPIDPKPKQGPWPKRLWLFLLWLGAMQLPKKHVNDLKMCVGGGGHGEIGRARDMFSKMNLMLGFFSCRSVMWGLFFLNQSQEVFFLFRNQSQGRYFSHKDNFFFFGGVKCFREGFFSPNWTRYGARHS